MAKADLRGVVAAASKRDLALTRVEVDAPGDQVIVPLISDDAVLGYRVAVPVVVDAGTDGRWTMYADPASGEPLVRHNRLHWATGTVSLDVPVRYPGGGRADYPAARAQVTVDGGTATTANDGVLSWTRNQRCR